MLKLVIRNKKDQVIDVLENIVDIKPCQDGRLLITYDLFQNNCNKCYLQTIRHIVQVPKDYSIMPTT